MKQTVEEAAKEMCEAWGMEDNHGYGVKDTFKVGFAQGAQWQAEQSPWISIEDKFPKENKAVLFLVDCGKNRYGYFVGVYYGNGCWESDHWVFLPDSNIGKTTHWMPIPENVSFEE